MVDPEREAKFAQVKREVQAYLISPKAGDPYEVVNTYFETTWGLARWCPEASDEATVLLKAIRTRSIEPTERHFDPRYGFVGTIAMGLPYFYPLNLTILGWLVYGRVGSAKNLDSQSKTGIAMAILDQVREFDVIGYDHKRHTDYVRRALLSQPEETPQNGLIQPNTISDRCWYSRVLRVIGLNRSPKN